MHGELCSRCGRATLIGRCMWCGEALGMVEKIQDNIIAYERDQLAKQRIYLRDMEKDSRKEWYAQNKKLCFSCNKEYTGEKCFWCIARDL